MQRLPFDRLLLAAGALGLALVAAPTTAFASPSFPGAVQEYLIATGQAPACPPACTLCHTSPAGGTDTVRETGFTQNLRDQSFLGYEQRGRKGPRALYAADDTTVGPSIQALETLMCLSQGDGKICDSDNDGIPDVAELRAGTDPDGPGGLQECPQYGCGASVAPRAARSSSEVPGAWLVAALGALAFVRRRR